MVRGSDPRGPVRTLGWRPVWVEGRLRVRQARGGGEVLAATTRDVTPNPDAPTAIALFFLCVCACVHATGGSKCDWLSQLRLQWRLRQRRTDPHIRQISRQSVQWNRDVIWETSWQVRVWGHGSTIPDGSYFVNVVMPRVYFSI